MKEQIKTQIKIEGLTPQQERELIEYLQQHSKEFEKLGMKLTNAKVVED